MGALLAGALAVWIGSAFYAPPRPEGRLMKRIRQEDPATIPMSLDVSGSFQYLTDASSALANRDHFVAQLLLASSGKALLANSALLRNHARLLGSLEDNLRRTDGAIIRIRALLLQGARDHDVSAQVADATWLLLSSGAALRADRSVLQELVGVLDIPHRAATDPIRRFFNQTVVDDDRIEEQDRMRARILRELGEGRLPSASLPSAPATLLEWSAPPHVYPGEPFTVAGVVKSQGAQAAMRRTLTLSIDGTVLRRVTVLDSFHMQLAAPDRLPIGWHTLTLTLEPGGRYAQVTQVRPLEVIGIPLTLDVAVRRFLWLPGSVGVSGIIRSTSGPVPQTPVEMHLGTVSALAGIRSDGLFSGTLGLPLGLQLGGAQFLSVEFVPTDRLHAPVMRVIPVFIANILYLGLSLAILLLLLAAFVYARGRRRGEESLSLSLEEASAVAAPRSAHLPVERSLVGQTLSPLGRDLVILYSEAVSRVEATTTLRLHSHLTLQEYGGAVAAVLGLSVFFEMTALVEIALYSAHPIGVDMIAQMRHLRSRLEEGIEHARA